MENLISQMRQQQVLKNGFKPFVVECTECGEEFEQYNSQADCHLCNDCDGC